MIKKLILSILLLCFVSIVQAQFTQAELGINGLTCSQCSRSVEMALKRLDFVASVNMDLQHPKAHVVFKKNEAIDFFKIANAVKNAGFSVRNIKANYNGSINADNCLLDNKTLYYPLADFEIKNKQTKILLLGKGFISDSELKRYATRIKAFKPDCNLKASKSIPYIIVE